METFLIILNEKNVEIWNDGILLNVIPFEYLKNVNLLKIYKQSLKDLEEDS